ncbi:uncharacterized protein LOC121249386 [Juglans microcarpa x Juglans regia]|uniref:uncharacterized protein LOC121249386 n=1 Tax=Juglans microcarpa x Juglans regia TaxID=2249226 RepID=UPI001B7EEE05|nr:uncharacterized protein LOC121249386 [Juglans microcarpa x Juglans regia]
MAQENLKDVNAIVTQSVNIFHIAKQPEDDDESHQTYMIESLMDMGVSTAHDFDPLEYFLVNSEFNSISDLSDVVDICAIFYRTQDYGTRAWQLKFEELPKKNDKQIPSSVEAPKAELKPLLKGLKHAFLGPGDIFLVTISSELSESQDEKLIRTLSEHKSALGWSITNIKGSSPLVYSHKINLEEGTSPRRDPQRRLNPTMKEVVKNEVLKLLDARIIYPIADSKWVSSTQVVPKRSSVTAVKNDLGQLGRIKVDQSKIELISKLPTPRTVKDVRSFLGHASFYRRIIQNFFTISRPVCDLLAKDAPFEWTQAVKGAIVGQRREGKPFVIYYASRTLNSAKMNYSTTKKELLAVVFALDKFCAYLIGSPIIIFTDHAALKYLLTNKDAKARLIRWILLLQEFGITIKDKKGVENLVANHLSRLTFEDTSDHLPIRDDFPDEHLLSITCLPWFVHIVNYLAACEIPMDWSSQDKRKFITEVSIFGA